MWLGLGVAVIVALVAVVLLQKKGGEVTRKEAIISEKDSAISQKESEISRKENIIRQKDELLAQKDTEINRLGEEIAAIIVERDEKRAALEKLEQEFEEKMDDVVQSSIQKIAHAEQAKEEAVRAAQDNYEAAAEVHALLKEKEALINKLQKQVTG